MFGQLPTYREKRSAGLRTLRSRCQCFLSAVLLVDGEKRDYGYLLRLAVEWQRSDFAKKYLLNDEIRISNKILEKEFEGALKTVS